MATKSRMLDLNQLIPVLIRVTASWRLLGSPSSSVAARLSALNELNSKARNRFSTFKNRCKTEGHTQEVDRLD